MKCPTTHALRAAAAAVPAWVPCKALWAASVPAARAQKNWVPCKLSFRTFVTATRPHFNQFRATSNSKKNEGLYLVKSWTRTLSSGSNKFSSGRDGTARSKHKLADSFNWLLAEQKNTCVVDGLKSAYRSKLLPLEQHYLFHDFHSPPLSDEDFDSLPLVLMIGQYSTGKSSLIKYLLRQDFPGIRVGPEPTTDRFIIVSGGDGSHTVPGHALVMDSGRQFAPLSKFGSSFLNRLELSTCSSPVLTGMSIIDTPGILSGEKQRIDRGYDFAGVVEWFAERVDRILLLFDAHKLDISDEFRSCIEVMRGHEDKIRIVLNKADMVDHQELMRVYGALMWSLGKVFGTPEVARVFIGSFWDSASRYELNEGLFYAEEQDLFQDLHSLTRNSTLRKLNDLIKRARLAKVHALIIANLKQSMPMLIGKEQKRKDLIENLEDIFRKIQKESNIPAGDFPDCQRMKKILENTDFSEFNRTSTKLVEAVDDMLKNDITDLMRKIPQEQVKIGLELVVQKKEQNVE